VATGEIEIGLTTLSAFLAATTPADRTRAVKTAVEMFANSYDPRNDFYKRMRTALERSVVINSDEPLELAIRNAPENKRGHYAQIAQGWQNWRPRQLASRSAEHAVWRSGSVAVKVNPLLATTVDKMEITAAVYLKAPDLSDNAAQAMNRIMELALGCSVGETAVLDVRRAKLKRGSKRRIRDYDDWLESEIAAFEDLFVRMQRAA